MKLEKLNNPEKYTGLYVVDFGDHSSTGFTGREVEILLESEKHSGIKVYKIHNAYPDGTLELRGISRELFELESGMFFYSRSREAAKDDYKRLLDLAADTDQFPVRAKLQLSHLCEDVYTVALIYPADADDDISRWLLDKGYQTRGAVKGGISAVTDYYAASPEIIDRRQLVSGIGSRSTSELYASLKNVVQR
jgi:hypothetical protein